MLGVVLKAVDRRGGNCWDWNAVSGEWMAVVYWVVIAGEDVSGSVGLTTVLLALLMAAVGGVGRDGRWEC